jgi:hypothetical protein
VNQEREALYEDALKQKLTANAFKEENVRLKTRLQALEVESLKKERLIDELLTRPDGGQASSVGGMTSSGKGGGPKKVESHLTQNLKRRIKEMQVVIAQKSEELELVKRSMKTTKGTEMEAEVRAYIEECQRLRT